MISTAGDATLSGGRPERDRDTGQLVNGAFALAQPLQAQRERRRVRAGRRLGGPTTLLTYAGPVEQRRGADRRSSSSIGANDALRTGTYSKTLTFTLSTTSP